MIKVYGSCKSAIYGSKLFQASSRKDKIRAAIENPVNAELVKQLDEYIGDEYRPKKKPSDESEEKSDTSAKAETDDSSSDDSSKPAPPPGSSLSEKYGDALNAEGEAAFEATQTSETSDTEETEESTESAESSTKVKKPSITGSSKPFGENYISLSGLAGELKGTLNARANTQGVGRVSVKNDEVWIYYNDDINLNNVMSPVIELLNAANYQYLIFNRLARTDNAIVFTVDGNDTLNEMEPVHNER